VFQGNALFTVKDFTFAVIRGLIVAGNVGYFMALQK